MHLVGFYYKTRLCSLHFACYEVKENFVVKQFTDCKKTYDFYRGSSFVMHRVSSMFA
jgi:hypothetical protein